MAKKDTRIKKGQHLSPATEFKKGEHWRKPQPFREKEWLQREYVEKQRSTGEIAQEFGVTDQAIIFWLRRHGIPRRTVAAARSVKRWGSAGEKNPMYGKRGKDVPNWKGGVTPERQGFYSSQSWADAVKVVWKRDQGTCQRCGTKANGGPAFHIHHIVSFQVKELRAEPSNLILLCVLCHRWVHSRANVNKDFIKQKGGQ